MCRYARSLATDMLLWTSLRGRPHHSSGPHYVSILLAPRKCIVHTDQAAADIHQQAHNQAVQRHASASL